MISLPIPIAPEAPGQTLGSTEGGGSPLVAPLDPFVYREMRWCATCGGEQLFVPVFEYEAGRVGVCFGCGEEKVQRFTRTTEVAA